MNNDNFAFDFARQSTLIVAGTQSCAAAEPTGTQDHGATGVACSRLSARESGPMADDLEGLVYGLRLAKRNKTSHSPELGVIGRGDRDSRARGNWRVGDTANSCSRG